MSVAQLERAVVEARQRVARLGFQSAQVAAELRQQRRSSQETDAAIRAAAQQYGHAQQLLQLVQLEAALTTEGSAPWSTRDDAAYQVAENALRGFARQFPQLQNQWDEDAWPFLIDMFQTLPEPTARAWLTGFERIANLRDDRRLAYLELWTRTLASLFYPCGTSQVRAPALPLAQLFPDEGEREFMRESMENVTQFLSRTAVCGDFWKTELQQYDARLKAAKTDAERDAIVEQLGTFIEYYATVVELVEA